MSDAGRQRHQSRERALEILYESALKERSVAQVVADQTIRPDEFAVELVTDADATRARADELISACAIDWPLERISLVDRLIMTIAIGELVQRSDRPVAVILDEAVELAKAYSSDGAPAFVNGVLSTVADLVRSS